MKIAVTYEEGKVFQHFGHTEHFKFYEVEDGKVTTSQVVDTNGSGHGALAGLLAEHQVDVLSAAVLEAAHRQRLRKWESSFMEE